MNQEQLSIFSPASPFTKPPADLTCCPADQTDHLQPVVPAADLSARQRVLDRMLDRVSKEDLPGKGYVEQYLRHKYRSNCKSNTLRVTTVSLVQFLTFLRGCGATPIEQLSRREIEAFVESLQDKGLKPTTVKIRLQNVYAFLRYLILEHQGFDDALIKRKLKLKLPDRLPRAIDPQHLDRLLSVIDNCRDRALILLLLRTGMRIGELLNCTLQDLDLHEQKIFIYQSEKTSVGRAVYYSEDAQQALLAWLRVRDPHKQQLFYGHTDKALCYAAARSIFQKYLQKAGLQYCGYSLHSLRHTFATDLLNVKMPLECLRVLLGHGSLEMTRRYARLTDKTREEEYFRAMNRILKGECDGDDQCDR